MKSQTFSGSIGSQIMIVTQQQRHQKRLSAIYNKGPALTSKTLNFDYLIQSSSRIPQKLSKKAFNDQMNHHLTLRHLIQRLNSPKTYHQRLKNQNDFIAYPSLFFRNTEKPPKKKKTFQPKKSGLNPSTEALDKKNPNDIFGINKSHIQPVLKAKKSKKDKKSHVQQNQMSASVNSEQTHNGLTEQKVMKELPKLKKFEQEDVQLFADHLTRLIFKYNLNTIEDIEFLFQCVEQYLSGQDYPEHFLCAIQDMFKQIVSSLNIEE